MMFTKTQGQELIDHTTSTWTTINGVNGRKFTSKTDSSKYIFLPAGGYWYDATRYNAGKIGAYYSTACYDPTGTWQLSVSSSLVSINYTINRYGARLLRSIRNR